MSRSTPTNSLLRSDSASIFLIGGAAALAAGLSAWNLCLAWQWKVGTESQEAKSGKGRVKRIPKRRRAAAPTTPIWNDTATTSENNQSACATGCTGFADKLEAPIRPSTLLLPQSSPIIPPATHSLKYGTPPLAPLRIGVDGLVPWDWRSGTSDLSCTPPPVCARAGDGTGSSAAVPIVPAHQSTPSLGAQLTAILPPAFELDHNPNTCSSWTTADPSLLHSFSSTEPSLDSLSTHYRQLHPQQHQHQPILHSQPSSPIPPQVDPSDPVPPTSKPEHGNDLLSCEGLFDALSAYVRSPLFGNGGGLAPESLFVAPENGGGGEVPTGLIRWQPLVGDHEIITQTASPPSPSTVARTEIEKPNLSEGGNGYSSTAPQQRHFSAIADPLAGTSLRLKVNRNPPISFFNAVAVGDILLTSTQQPLKSLAGNLAVRMRKRKQVVLMISPPSAPMGDEASAIDGGTENTNHTMKALCVAQNFVEFNDIDISCRVEWVEGTLAILCFPGINRKDLTGQSSQEASIRIAGKTAPPPVHTAGLIANRLRAHGLCSLMVMGADSVVQALRSLCLVHNFVERADPVWFSPRFISTVSAEGKRSGIEIVVHQNPPMHPIGTLSKAQHP